MKQFNYYFIIMALAFVGFGTSCSSEDDGPDLQVPGEPTISVTVSPEGTEYNPGTELTFTVTASAATGSKLFNLEVTPIPNGQSDSGLDSYIYNTAEVFIYTYVVPFGSDNVNINFQVTAVNAEDYNLFKSATTSMTFGVTNDFTEHRDVKLNNLYGDSNAKSMLRFDTGDIYSYQESYDGDDDLKLSIDMFAYTSVTTDDDGVETKSAFLLGTGGVPAGEAVVWVSWGDGSFTEKRGLDSNPYWNIYNQLDYDAFLPEDIYVGGQTSVVEVKVGDVITFDNAPQGNYAPAIYPEYHQKADIDGFNDVTGAIQIVEINYGTAGDGSDGYIVFNYKYVEK